MTDYQGNRLSAICYCFIVFNTLFVLCRCISLHLIRKSEAGLDDFFVLAGYLTNLGMCIVGIVLVKTAHVGYHILYALEMDPDTLSKWHKTLYVFEILYMPSNSFPKLSVLALYYRIFSSHKWMRLSVKFLMYMIGAYWMSFTLVAIFQCIPVQGYWDGSVAATCINDEAFFKSLSIPSAIIDIPILILPLPLLAKIQVSKSKKAGLFAVFFCGSIGLVACCVRIVLFFQRNAFLDATWVSVDLSGMSIIEPSMYLIAACLITMRPLLNFLTQKSQEYLSPLFSPLGHTKLLIDSDSSRGAE